MSKEPVTLIIQGKEALFINILVQYLWLKSRLFLLLSSSILLPPHLSYYQSYRCHPREAPPEQAGSCFLQ